jgi:GntR family transcriptional regulator
MYQWSMTEAPGRDTLKQRVVRERLETLLATMQAGEPLPSERDLARDIGVARMTLRRVVDAMAAEGRLIRRHGSGTFAAQSLVDQRLTATSFSADMRARGLRPGSRTVAWRQAPAGIVLSAVLGVPASAPVLQVRRLRLADDLPMAIEDLNVPCDLVPGLSGEDLQDVSFYEVLARRFDRPVVSGTQTVEPHLVDSDEAQLLGVAPGLPSFCFERTSRTSDGRVAEFVRSIYRGDRYRIVVDIFPRADPPGDDVAGGQATNRQRPDEGLDAGQVDPLGISPGV